MAWLSERRPDFTAATGDGLLPVVVQDATDGAVLMLAWANAEALAATERSGEAHFWSRSRDELWRKGATSGNVMDVVDLGADCDADAILYRVRPRGPACHTGTRSCFGEADAPAGGTRILDELDAVIASRRGADPDRSYTARLLADRPRAAQKVIEEAGEVAVAALGDDGEALAAEAADLLYHLLVVLAGRGVPLDRALDILRERRAAG